MKSQRAIAKTRTPKSRELVDELIVRLPRIYPDAHCELEHSNPLELLVATILSAQCTDKRVNIVTGTLFRKFRSAADYANVPQEELEADIKTTGFFRSKAKNIRAMAADLVAKHGGEVPRTMEELTSLAGVGRKTANVVLGNAFGIEEGVVVDTHVQRLSGRFRITKHSDPVKVEADLAKLVPRKHWTIFSHWLIWHGRRRCYARNPDCGACELQDICPSAFLYVPAGRAELTSSKSGLDSSKNSRSRSRGSGPR